jgi:hypothetical protein
MRKRCSGAFDARWRTSANAIRSAWQCGGQGFESPQLRPVDQAVLPREDSLSCIWCQRGGRWSHHGVGGPHSALPMRWAASRPRAGMTWCRSPWWFASVRGAEHLHDDPGVHARRQQQRRLGVTSIVQSALPYPASRWRVFQEHQSDF